MTASKDMGNGSRCRICTRPPVFHDEDMEITTYLEASLSSELSANVIDLCPVGALTSKPFRYSARTWELSRRKSVSPTGW